MQLWLRKNSRECGDGKGKTIMKTLQQLYTEILGSDEMKKSFAEAARDGKISEFLKAQGCEATTEEVQTFLKEKGR